MAKTKMTESSKRVFDFLKAAGPGVKFTTKQVQSALNLEKAGSVTGSVTGLCKKGYCVRFSEPGEDGKEIKYFALTEEGMAFDPDADVEE